METLNIGSNKYTEVVVVDEPALGSGACHQYLLTDNDTHAAQFGSVRFQNGPIKEHGVNGCHQEDLLAIVIHRLQCFQKGEFACRENALALTKLEEAMHWLNHRTFDRNKRGVEGTSKL